MTAHSYPGSQDFTSSRSREYSYNVENENDDKSALNYIDSLNDDRFLAYQQSLYNNDVNIYHSTSLNRELEGINLLASRSASSYFENLIKSEEHKRLIYNENLNESNTNLLTPQSRLTHKGFNEGVSSNKISSNALSPSLRYCTTPIAKKLGSYHTELNSNSSIRFNPTSLISLPFGYNNNTFTKIKTDEVAYPSIYKKATRITDGRADRRFKKVPHSMFGYNMDFNEDFGSDSNDSTTKSYLISDFIKYGPNKSVYNLMKHNDYSTNPYKRRYHSLINERRRLLSSNTEETVDHVSLPDKFPKRQRKTTTKPRPIISEEVLEEESDTAEEFLLKKQKDLIAYSLPSLSSKNKNYIDSIELSNKTIEDYMLREMIDILTHSITFKQNVYNSLNNPEGNDETKLYNKYLFTEEKLIHANLIVKRALLNINNDITALNYAKGMLKSDYDNINSDESYQQNIDSTYNVKRLKRLFRQDQYTLINSYIDENYYEDIEQPKENYILLTSPSMAFYNGLKCLKGLCSTSDYLFKNNVFTECDSCSGCYLWPSDKKEFTSKGFGTVGAWTLDQPLIYDVMNQNKNKIMNSTLSFINDLCKVAIAEVRIPKPEFSEFTEYNCINGYCCNKCCTCKKGTEQSKLYTSTVEHEPTRDDNVNFTLDTKIATVDLLKSVMGSCSCYCNCHDHVHVFDRVVNSNSNVKEYYNEAISWYDVDITNMTTDSSNKIYPNEHIVQERVILRVKLDSIPMSWKLAMPFTCKLNINLNKDAFDSNVNNGNLVANIETDVDNKLDVDANKNFNTVNKINVNYNSDSAKNFTINNNGFENNTDFQNVKNIEVKHEVAPKSSPQSKNSPSSKIKSKVRHDFNSNQNGKLKSNNNNKSSKKHKNNAKNVSQLNSKRRVNSDTSKNVNGSFFGNDMNDMKVKGYDGKQLNQNIGVKNFKYLEDFTFWDALDILRDEMELLHSNIKKDNKTSIINTCFDAMEIDTSTMNEKSLVLNTESFATDSKCSYVEIALYLPYVPSHILPWEFVSVEPSEILINKMEENCEKDEVYEVSNMYAVNLLKEYNVITLSFKRVLHFMKMWINSRNDLIENERVLYEEYKRKWHVYIDSFDKSEVDLFSWGILPVRAMDMPDMFVPLPAGYKHDDISYPYTNNDTISPFHIEGYGIADIDYRKISFSELSHNDETENGELNQLGNLRHRELQLARRKNPEDSTTNKLVEPDTQSRLNAYLMPVFSNLTGPSVRWTQCLMDGPKEPLEWIPDFRSMPVFRVMKCPEMNFYSLDNLVVYDRKNFLSNEELLEDELNYRLCQVWSLAEVKTFVEKYLMYPKNFSKIAQYLENKKCGDCVEFYYRFKYRLRLKNRVQELRTKIKTKIDMTKNLKREALIMNSLNNIMDACNTEIVKEFNKRNKMSFNSLSDYLLRCGSLDSTQNYYVQYTYHQEPQSQEDEYQHTLDNIAEGYFLPSKFLTMTTRKTVEYTASAAPDDDTLESKKGCFLFDYSEEPEEGEEHDDDIDPTSELAKSFVVSLNFESYVNNRCKIIKKLTLSNLDKLLFNYDREGEFYQEDILENQLLENTIKMDDLSDLTIPEEDNKQYFDEASNNGSDSNHGMVTRKKIISHTRYDYDSPQLLKQAPRPKGKKKPSKWTKEERMTYRETFITHGKDWSKLYSALAPYGKSLDQIKNFYHKNNYRMQTDTYE